MLAKRRLLALVLIGSGIASAACSLITDVDRSKIEGSGGSDLGGSSSDSGTDTGGRAASGGSSSHDAGNKSDAANDASDAD